MVWQAVNAVLRVDLDLPMSVFLGVLISGIALLAIVTAYILTLRDVALATFNHSRQTFYEPSGDSLAKAC